jgi:hypothetical protein
MAQIPKDHPTLNMTGKDKKYYCCKQKSDINQ